MDCFAERSKRRPRTPVIRLIQGCGDVLECGGSTPLSHVAV